MDEERAATLQAENNQIKKKLQEQFGWFWLAKEVADYCNTTYFMIMERAAVEVLSLVIIIQNKTEFNKLSNHAPKP